MNNMRFDGPIVASRSLHELHDVPLCSPVYHVPNLYRIILHFTGRGSRRMVGVLLCKPDSEISMQEGKEGKEGKGTFYFSFLFPTIGDGLRMWREARKALEEMMEKLEGKFSV